MFNLAQIARHPALAGFFAEVHPLFWPVLLWHLMRVRDRLVAAGCHEGGMILIRWWGRVDLIYASDPVPSPSAYRPITPQRKAWDDPIWSTAVPAFLAAEASTVIFPCFSGGFEGKAFALHTPREVMKGAYALPATADTS